MLSGAAIHQQAKSVVILAEKLVVSLLRQNFFQMFKISPTDFEKAMRIAKFERHFRAIDRNYSGWRFGKKWFPRNTCLRDARTLTPCFLRVEI